MGVSNGRGIVTVCFKEGDILSEIRLAGARSSEGQEYHPRYQVFVRLASSSTNTKFRGDISEDQLSQHTFFFLLRCI